MSEDFYNSEAQPNRVGYFPQFLSGELAFSTFSRFSKRFGSLPARVASRQLFGKPVRLLIDYPKRLLRLCDALPPGHGTTPAKIIDGDHTFFNIHRAFLPSDRLKNIRQGMMTDHSRGINIRTGELTQGILSKNTLFCCQECFEEDKSKFGFPLWHTVHQLPGVFVCPKHEVLLVDTKILTVDLRSYICADRNTDAVLETYNPIDVTADILLRIARNMSSLLKNPMLTYDALGLRQRYLQVLKTQNFATTNGSVRIKQFENAFRQFYSHTFLRSIGCELKGKHSRNWLNRIAQTGQIQHPLRHVLVMVFLGINVKDFFSFSLENKPFGYSPWPCLNSICPDYHQPIIEKVHLGISRKSSRNPLGTFKCPTCGYVYTRVGPDKSPDDNLKGKVLEYGHLWDNKLIELWDADLFQYEKADLLGVGQDTLKRHARRLDLLDDGKSYTKSIATLSDLPGYKNEWLSIISSYPETTLSELIDKHPDVYWTIARFDIQFLETNRPDRQANQEQDHPAAVDWNARDTCYASKIIDAVQCILSRTDPLERVTENSIGIELGFRDGSFSRDLQKMPNTSREVQMHVESHVLFAMRRIDYAGNHYIQEKVTPTEWQFVKRAGLSRDMRTEGVLSYLRQVKVYISKKLGHQ